MIFASTKRLAAAIVTVVVTVLLLILATTNRSIETFDPRIQILELKLSHGKLHQMYVGRSQLESKARKLFRNAFAPAGIHVDVPTLHGSGTASPTSAIMFRYRIPDDELSDDGLCAELMDEQNRIYPLNRLTRGRNYRANEHIDTWIIDPAEVQPGRYQLRLRISTNAPIGAEIRLNITQVL